MKFIWKSTALVSLTVTVAIVVLPIGGHAGVATSAGAAATHGWMPDVAQRVAELRERTERAAAEARDRRSRESRGGQWWRAVAAVPAGTPVR